MVLTTRSFTSSTSSSSSRLLSRSLLASTRSSLRSFHNVSSRTSSPLRASSLRPSVQGCSSMGLHQQSLWAQQKFPASVRLLTTQKREKVKVLAVLYDGGKHGEEVRRSTFPFPNPTSHLLHSVMSAGVATHLPWHICQNVSITIVHDRSRARTETNKS